MSSGGFIFLEVDGEGSPTPISALYAVFRRSALASDLHVQELARSDLDDGLEVERHVPADVLAAFQEQLGAPVYDQTRLVVGTIERGIYAVPTTAEAICVGSFPLGGSGCVRPTRHGVCVDYDAADDDSSFLLYGIVGDDVASVEAVVGGQTREAELGENGYRLEVPDHGPDQLQELILHFHGGATDRLNLHIPNPLK
jgi:hypothetical protein